MKKIVVAYVPVLHSGYKNFFERHSDADVFYIFEEDLIESFDYLRKEIRALAPGDVVAALREWFGEGKVKLLTRTDLAALKKEDVQIVAPKEDVTEELLSEFQNVEYEKVFLRWNRTNSLAATDVSPGRSVKAGEFEKEVFGKVFEESEQTGDWWLQVGAAVVKDEKTLLTGHGRYGQSPHQVWSEGDPRNCFWRGVNIELTTSLHAERGLIAEAAKQGISLFGSDMYVTHFPCPVCAKMIAASGIKKLFYVTGYAVLDGQSVLEQSGVEIVRVEGIEVPEMEYDYLEYPEKKKTDE